jgi:hypothetical protein
MLDRIASAYDQLRMKPVLVLVNHFDFFDPFRLRQRCGLIDKYRQDKLIRRRALQADCKHSGTAAYVGTVFRLDHFGLLLRRHLRPSHESDAEGRQHIPNMIGDGVTGRSSKQ